MSTLYTLGPDDEINHLMVYTQQEVVWGESIGKKTIRFLKLMRTPMCPAYIVLYNAKLLPANGKSPLAFPVVHIPIIRVMAVHPTPPHQEEYDFNPEEPNRKMEAVTTLIGGFRIDGKMRISTRTNVTQALDVAKEPYIALYDVQVTALNNASQKALSTKMAVVRRTEVLLSAYTTEMETSL